MKFLGKTIMFYESRTSLMDFPGGPDGKVSAYSVGETSVRLRSQEDPLEKETATHSSILVWKIPWMKQPSGLQSMGVQKSRT